jgi:putative toxin-antitoxin system antitoxin component (TIGR02293 family)
MHTVKVHMARNQAMTHERGFSEAPVRWMEAVRQGLPVSMVDEVVAEGRLTAAELDRLAIPRKTLAHRRTLGRLTAEQSDRLARILRVIETAEQVFGEARKAAAWLRRPSSALNDDAPLDLLDTDLGTRQVESLLGRIAHGIAA